MSTKHERCEAANELLKEIANCGRRFFYHDGRVSRFEIDYRGRIWFIDKYREARLYCHGPYALTSPAFTEGGTLASLCRSLAACFIQDGMPIHQSSLGPWPEWLCDGDLWGYGEDMEKIRDRAAELGVVASWAVAS